MFEKLFNTENLKLFFKSPITLLFLVIMGIMAYVSYKNFESRTKELEKCSEELRRHHKVEEQRYDVLLKRVLMTEKKQQELDSIK